MSLTDDHKSNYAFEHQGRAMWKCLVCGLVMGGDPGVRCDTCMGWSRETTNLICQDCGRDWAEDFPTPTFNAVTSRASDPADPLVRRQRLEGFAAALLCRERHDRPENAEACAGCKAAAVNDYGADIHWLATLTAADHRPEREATAPRITEPTQEASA